MRCRISRQRSRTQPDHGEAQFLLGQLLNSRGSYAEAETALRASASHVEAGSDYLTQLATALLGQRKLDEAEETARSILRVYPEDARASALLGEIYLDRGRYEQARDHLIQALQIDRNDPRAQIALGRTWLAIGRTRGDAQDLAKAREVLTSARGVHEGDRLLTLGQVAIAEEDLVSADSLLARSLDNGAAPLRVYLSMAESKTLGDDLAGAADVLRRASELRPDDPAIALSLAVNYARLGESALATELFLKTLQGIGMLGPPGEQAGPVMLPTPYVPRSPPDST